MAAHVDEPGAVPSAVATQDPTLAAGIELQGHTVADLDQLGQIDSTVEEAAKRGRADAALSTIDAQYKARPVLTGDRQGEASTLADFTAECATLGVKGRQIEAEAAPIGHVAEPIGGATDSEWAIRWLLTLMVLCCDPPARALTTAASVRNRPQSDAA